MTKMTINNRPVEIRIDPQTPLLWALRDVANLTGAKYGCDSQSCYMCVVDVDGEAMRACAVTIGEMEGRFITTIEGLSSDRSHPVQQAWAAANLPQCGFCQPGMIMSAAILLKNDANPSREKINDALQTICRCGTSVRVHDAIKVAIDAIRTGEKLNAVPAPGIDKRDAARHVPAFRIVNPDEDKAANTNITPIPPGSSGGKEGKE